MTFPISRKSGLSGTAAALALVFGSLLPASQASAGIVYSGSTSILIPVSTSGIYLNVVTNASGTSTGSAAGWDLNLWGSGSLFTWAASTGGVVTGLGASTTAVDNLALGTVVNSSLTTAISPSGIQVETGATAFQLNSSSNYIGFSFLNEATGITNYGWMQLSIGAAFNSSTRAIVGYAYDDSGAGIAVGSIAVVPEPASAALLAAGLLGIGVWGRRRQG